MKKIKIIFLILCCWCTSVFGYEIHPLDKMPILRQLPNNQYGTNLPVEQRGEEYRKFLSLSVKIKVSNGMGSGSIIYYDPKSGLAYVASCGHLWTNGVLNYEDAKKKNIKCKVVVWYKNSKKLETPQEFDGKLLFYSYTNEIDTSLVSFTPDWVPDYLPVAPIDYTYQIGSNFHSLGCDGGREVAHYDVMILEVNGDVVTKNNSPRPGRSGGGLFDKNFYIGTCWGTEYVDGSGRGFFTPIKDIHYFWEKQKDYNFLLKISSPIVGKLIPVRDRNSKQQIYREDYILVP